MNEIFDIGLQPERTALAWRRTGLALLAGSLIATRVLPELLGPWAALLGFAGVIAAAILLIGIHRRYRDHYGSLKERGDRVPLAGGRLIAAVTLFSLGAGVVSALVVAVIVIGNIPH